MLHRLAPYAVRTAVARVGRTSVTLVAEIEVTAHRNSNEARLGLEALQRPKVAAGAPDAASDAAAGDAELARLAQGASFEAVLGTASRLRMPDLLDFLR